MKGLNTITEKSELPNITNIMVYGLEKVRSQPPDKDWVPTRCKTHSEQLADIRSNVMMMKMKKVPI
jgi:hypothetical protein